MFRIVHFLMLFRLVLTLKFSLCILDAKIRPRPNDVSYMQDNHFLVNALMRGTAYHQILLILVHCGLLKGQLKGHSTQN